MIHPAAFARTPAELTLNVSARCNLRCRYCSFFDSDSAVEQELSSARWLEAIREAGRLNVMKIAFGGAEPFLRPDILELMAEAVKSRMRFSAISNGFFITRENARAIAAFRRCDAVQVSLDGMERVHDPVRGDGAFAAAVAAIRTLKEAGVPVHTRITLGRHNLGCLAETVRFLLDELRVDRISTNSVTSFNTNRKELGDLALSLPEYLLSMQEHRELPREHQERLSAAAGPWKSLRQWEKIEQRVKARQPRENYCRCSRIFYSLAIRSDGAVIPCSQYPELVLGNIGEQSLADIWAGTALNELRRRVMDTQAASGLSKCAGCEWRIWCGGACPSISCRDNVCYRDYKESGLVLDRGD